MGWAVVLTKHGSEEIAEGLIIQTGFNVYLPRYRKRLRGVRLGKNGRRIRTRGPGEIVYRALFPNYLFVELTEGDDPALELIRGVQAVLRRRLPHGGFGPPRLIGSEIIGVIRDIVASGKWDEVGEIDHRSPRVNVKIGDKVRVGAGDWGGVIGKLIDLDEQGRARLLTEFLGELREIPVSAETPLQFVST